MNNRDISSEFNFFSFAEVGNCDHLYETAQNHAQVTVTTRESAVAMITNIFKKQVAETLTKPLTVTAICAQRGCIAFGFSSGHMILLNADKNEIENSNP